MLDISEFVSYLVLHSLHLVLFLCYISQLLDVVHILLSKIQKEHLGSSKLSSFVLSEDVKDEAE